MLNRPSPESVSENPLLESPYYQVWDFGLGSFPINNDWLLLDNENFTWLDGSDWSFLGSF